MKFADIATLVEEKLDGRKLPPDKHIRWSNLVRQQASSPSLTGFHGLYFLYKGAYVLGGTRAGVALYQLPDDYLGDLSLYYDGKLIPKIGHSIGSMLDQPQGEVIGTPQFFRMAGRHIEFIPAPSEDGHSIKMFYCSKPMPVAGLEFADYFLESFPDLHIYGMAVHAAEFLASGKVDYFRGVYADEVNTLIIENRKFWMSHTHMRFQSWDEMEQDANITFPQFEIEGYDAVNQNR